MPVGLYRGRTIPARLFGKSLFLLFAVLLLPLTPVLGQDQSEPLILQQADSSEVLRVGDETEYHLYGDVRFRQGESRLASDRAVWREQLGEVRFNGHVRIHQPGRYLEADQVVYRRDNESFSASGRVLVDDTTQGFSVRSEHVSFDRDHEVARADSFPVMYLDFYLDSAEQTIVHADTLVFYRSERRGVAIGSVRVRKGEWQAEGGFGEIWPDSGRAVITEQPRAIGIGGKIAGDTLVLSFHGKSMDHLQALGHATGAYRDSSEAGGSNNLIRGRTADFFLTNDSLRAIRVVGEAYTNQIPDDPTAGRNHASGDSLWLRFQSGRLRTVTISGGAQGEYRAVDKGGQEDTINYKAARIVFVPDSNRIDLLNSANLHYHNIQLDAGQISYWTDTRNLLARPPVPGEAPVDSSDTTGNKPAAQRPRLADGEQVVVGDTLTYNIDSRRGRIRGSSTEFEGGYYHGEDLRKYTEDVFFVSGGSYTTCDLSTPHFRFESRDMEILRNDKIIARHVVMRIGELPVAFLPFYVFPIKSGRHSGFLPLRFGNFDRGRRFISNAGYYWAVSDYLDLEGALDFNEETGVLLRSKVNYAKRYKYSGTLSASYARESRFTRSGSLRSTRWRINGNHRQTLSPTASLSGTADFLSDKKYYDEYTYNPNDRRQRTLRSQLNFTKRFSGASLILLVESTENLDTENRTRRLPQVDFSLFQRRLFAPDSGVSPRWYQNAYVSLSSRMTSYANRLPTPGDTTGRFDERRYVTLDHRGSLSFPQRLFGQITLSPAASFEEAWYYVFDTRLAREQGVPVRDPGRRLSGTLGLGLNTNLYGFLNPRLFGLTAIRHTLTPNIRYSFTPAIAQNNELRAFTGAGGGSARRSQTVSFSVSNVLDAKLGEGEDAKKVSLLTSSFSANYNFEREIRKWSNLSGNIRTNLARRLELSSNATWDLYDLNSGELRWTRPRLLNFGVTAAMNLRGSASPLSSVTNLGTLLGEDSLFTSGNIPFNIGLSYRYDESRGSFGTSKTHWISTRIDFQPTTNWSVAIQNRYDVVSKRITDQTFQINRDLHCWRAQFVWRPGGSGQGYYFWIGVKDIPDIKFERSESGLRGALWR